MIPSKNVTRYLELRSELKKARQQESLLLDKMDLLWQAMTMEEREEIRSINPSWPPPALEKKHEDDNGNG